MNTNRAISKRLKWKLFMEEKYSFPPPPIYHGRWDVRHDWYKYVDQCGKFWLNKAYK